MEARRPCLRRHQKVDFPALVLVSLDFCVSLLSCYFPQWSESLRLPYACLTLFGAAAVLGSFVVASRALTGLV